MQTELTYGAAPEVVADLVSMAWRTFVGDDLGQIDEPVSTEHVMCASISIHGPWSATLLLFTHHDVAFASTAAVLGMTIAELRSRKVFTLAITRSDGTYEPNPPDDRVLARDEHLIVSGSSEAVAALG